MGREPERIPIKGTSGLGGNTSTTVVVSAARPVYQATALERLLERVIPYTVAPEGGGQTVIDGTKEGLTTGALSSDVETALHCLVSKLEAAASTAGRRGTDALQDDGILLDVEIGDVRLLALRRGRPSSMSLLSPREQEIARMVARGYANKTIASVLEISSWTVASHLRRIFMKLQVSSRAAMVTCLWGMGSGQFPALLDDVIDDGVTSAPRPPQMDTISHRPSSEIPTATTLRAGHCYTPKEICGFTGNQLIISQAHLSYTTGYAAGRDAGLCTRREPGPGPCNRPLDMVAG